MLKVYVKKGIRIYLRVVLVAVAIPLFIEPYRYIESGIAGGKRGDVEHTFHERPISFWIAVMSELSLPLFLIFLATYSIREVSEGAPDESKRSDQENLDD